MIDSLSLDIAGIRESGGEQHSIYDSCPQNIGDAEEWSYYDEQYDKDQEEAEFASVVDCALFTSFSFCWRPSGKK